MNRISHVTSTMNFKYNSVFCGLVVLFLFSACAERTGILRYDTPDTKIVWPGDPEIPRYQYVGQLTGEGNIIKEKEGRLVKVFKWLVGLYSAKVVPTVLQRPQSGAVDELRNKIYVTDGSSHAIYVFDLSNGTLETWKEATKQGINFITPIGIAVGEQGSIYVADADLQVVIKLNSDGKPQSLFGRPHLKRPTGLAYDPGTGNVYVTDTHEHNIKVFDKQGQLLKTIGRRGTELGEFNFPTHVAFADNRLYVTDTLNARIQILHSSGEVFKTFGKRGLFIGDLPRPKGVTVDQFGNIYVIESYYDHLLVYDPKGNLLLPIGGEGNGIGQFYLPAGIWSDSKNRIYIADMFNGRIVVFQYLHSELSTKNSTH